MKFDLSRLSNAQFNIICGALIGVVDIGIVTLSLEARKPGGVDLTKTYNDVKKFIGILYELAETGKILHD